MAVTNQNTKRPNPKRGARNDGRGNARARVAAAQAAQRRRDQKRRRLFTLTVALVAIVAIAGVGISVKLSKSHAAAFAAPASAAVDPYVNSVTHTNDPTAVLYGSPDAKVTLTVFEDARCPFCDIFEVGASSIYKKYVDAGEVKVYFHVVKLIDVNDASAGQNASGSRMGGSALACAANAGLFDAYHDVLYANQPSETTDSFSDPATLINLAKKVPGLDTPTFESCVRNVTYGGFVDQNWTDFNTLQLPGTPTIELNGSQLSNGQLYSPSSTVGVTANTRTDGQGVNTAGVNAALQSAVTKAYGSATPAPWTGAGPNAAP